MRATEALRTLLLELADSDDDTEAGQLHQERADNILAVLMHNRMAAGSIMCAMASVIVFGWMENADQLDPDEAVRQFTDEPAGGEPIPYLKDFMQSFVDGYRDGHKLGIKSSLIAGRITLSLEYTSLILWLLGLYLIYSAPATAPEREQFIDGFIASTVRQGIIVDDELAPVPPHDFT